MLNRDENEVPKWGKTTTTTQCCLLFSFDFGLKCDQDLFSRLIYHPLFCVPKSHQRTFLKNSKYLLMNSIVILAIHLHFWWTFKGAGSGKNRTAAPRLKFITINQEQNDLKPIKSPKGKQSGNISAHTQIINEHVYQEYLKKNGWRTCKMFSSVSCCALCHVVLSLKLSLKTKSMPNATSTTSEDN